MINKIVESKFYLTIAAERRGSYYRLLTPRTTKGKPNVGKNEITLEIKLKLPKTLFERPQLQATIEIDPEVVSDPAIDADVVNNIVELARVEGIELEITVGDDG